MPNVSKNDQHADTWRRMIKAGYTISDIARQYHVSRAIIRYVTDPVFRAKASTEAREWHQRHRKEQAESMAEARKWWEGRDYIAAPVGFTALPEKAAPEPVIVEFFSHMPA